MKKYPPQYLEYIKNNVGSSDYRNHFIFKEDIPFDILQDGRFSCAKFVSEVLKRFKMISGVHATVKSTKKDMLLLGWKEKELKDIKRGDVIIWERNFKKNLHIGFYIGKYKAISNSSVKRVIWKHHYKYRGKRKVVSVLSFLDAS